jgi:DNA repair protein RadC
MEEHKMNETEHMTIKELPEGERPYERFISAGADALSDAELLAIIIRTGTGQETAMGLAGRVLNSVGGSIVGLHDTSAEELCLIQGIGMVKATQLKCVAELSKRLSRTNAKRSLIFDKPRTVADYYMEAYRHLDKERSWVVFLNASNKFLGDYLLSIGTVNQTLVSARDLFKEALRYRAVFFMLLHNHPSGDPSPSRQDVLITKKLQEAGKILDIEMIDHIIIGDNRYISLKEIGIF